RGAVSDGGVVRVGCRLWPWLNPSWALEDPEPARATYLASWREFASERELRRALELVPPTGLFPYVLQIRRQYDATQAHSDYGTYLPQRLRQLLLELSRAGS